MKMRVSVSPAMTLKIENFRPKIGRKTRPPTPLPRRPIRVRSRLLRLLWVVPLLVMQYNTVYGQDQTTTDVTDLASVFSGVVSDSENKPVPGVAMDFWLGEEKIGSTVSDESGAFEVRLTVDESPAESVVQVSSIQGYSQFTLSQNATGLALQLRQVDTRSGPPTWVLAFFATILPIVVIAIVVLAIRNRRPREISD